MAPEQACAAATHEPATGSMFVPGSFGGKIYNIGTFPAPEISRVVVVSRCAVNLRSTNFSATNSFQRAMSRAMAAKMGLG